MEFNDIHSSLDEGLPFMFHFTDFDSDRFIIDYDHDFIIEWGSIYLDEESIDYLFFIRG
jgi:hypothetical protein